MNPFEGFILGKSDDSVRIESSGQQQIAALMMAQQARLHIDIFSRELDPAVYDTPEFVDAVKELVLRSRRSRVRILVVEGQIVAQRGHRLIDLALSLSTYMSIRKPSPVYRDFNESIFLADSTGYIRLFSAARFDGIVNFNDPRESKLLMETFEEAWERGAPDPNFRRLTI